MALLSPTLLRQLERLQLLAQRRAKSSARGERRSRARGQSVEFADFRNYVTGDDFRYLDWNLFARLDRLFLKLYEEEREMPVTIFLDASESMAFGTPTKFQFARQIAAAVGYVALCGYDRLQVQVFPDSPSLDAAGAPAAWSVAEQAARAALRSVRGRRSSLQYFDLLERLTPGGTASFNQALRRAALNCRGSGAAIILSDFLDPTGYEQGLQALVGRGLQTTAVQILSREEVQPEVFGDLKMLDAESGAVQEVTFSRHRAAAYRQTVNGFIQRLSEHCVKRGIRFFSAQSDMDLESLLLRQWRAAEVWR